MYDILDHNQKGVIYIMPINETKLSKTMSYALRHHPEEFNLHLDIEGWCSIDDLLNALRSVNTLQDVAIQDLESMMKHSEKKRFELKNDKIRAYYGHSFDVKVKYNEKQPPDFLYHGTARRFINSIKKQGLIAKQRQYVHLSSDRNTAYLVGKRHDDYPIILKINAKKAYADGIVFYDANDATWLCEALPITYIDNL